MMNQWEHKVLHTAAPPTEEELKDLGLEGFQLISVLYSPELRQWVSYFVKLLRQDGELESVIFSELGINEKDVIDSIDNPKDVAKNRYDEFAPPGSMDDIPF